MARLMKPSQRNRKRKQPAIGKPPPSPVVKVHPASSLGWVIPVLIFIITMVVFIPTLQNGFVNWDDESFLVANSNYRGSSWQQFRWMFTTCYLSSCMPLTWVTYSLDYVFWGMNPFGYHLSSLLIHAANAVLFYFVGLRLLRLSVSSPNVSRQLPIRLAAGFAALFFALHPLQVEVVAWAIGREMAVAGFFFFLTLLCYLRAVENESKSAAHWRWMGAAWLCYAMSLLGKEVAMTLPVVLLVLDVYPLRRLGGERGWFGPQVRPIWWGKVPFCCWLWPQGCGRCWEKRERAPFIPLRAMGCSPRVAQVLYSLAFYSLEDSSTYRFVSALSFAWFHRNLGTAIGF